MFKVILHDCLGRRAISQITLLQAKSKKVKVKVLNGTTDWNLCQNFLLLKCQLLTTN